MSHSLISNTFSPAIADAIQSIEKLHAGRGERLQGTAHLLALLVRDDDSARFALGALGAMVNEVRQNHAELLDLRHRDVTDGADPSEHFGPGILMRDALRRLQDEIHAMGMARGFV